jgi:hypothetical protein
MDTNNSPFNYKDVLSVPSTAETINIGINYSGLSKVKTGKTGREI